MRMAASVMLLSVIGMMAETAVADNFSHTSDAHAYNSKRLIIDCMNKRMAANRTLSYNEASRICTDQVREQLTAQAPLAASGTPQRAVSAP